MFVFLSLRLSIDSGPYLLPKDVTNIGFELIKYNILDPRTYGSMFAVVGIIPVLAIITLKKWPNPLKSFFWAIVPIWFVVHASFSILAEGKVFLVPQTIVFIPAALQLLLSKKE